jgi:steroid delta-isomerase-like uncharacterized protein
MSELNSVLVERAIAEVWNKGNYAILNELVASDVVIHSSTPGEEIHGPEGIKQFYSELRAAFPDIHFTVEDQITQRDRVVTHWSARATHKGEFQGIAPTGKQVNLSGIDIDRLVNGKVVECWPIVDELNLLQQLGVLPTHGQVEPH